MFFVCCLQEEQKIQLYPLHFSLMDSDKISNILIFWMGTISTAYENYHFRKEARERKFCSNNGWFIKHKHSQSKCKNMCQVNDRVLIQRVYAIVHQRISKDYILIYSKMSVKEIWNILVYVSRYFISFK